MIFDILAKINMLKYVEIYAFDLFLKYPGIKSQNFRDSKVADPFFTAL